MFFFEKQSSLQSADRGLNVSNFPNDIEIYLYKQVSISNQQEHFFSHLSQRIGDPFWAHTEIYANRATNKELVFLPFGFYGTKEIKAVLQGVRDLDKPNSDYKLQLFLRSELLNYSKTSSYVNEIMAAQFGDFEYAIYGVDNSIWTRVFENIQTINSVNQGVRAACEDIPVTICYEIPCPFGGGGGDPDDGWFSSGIGLYSGFGKWIFTLGGGSGSGGSSGGLGNGGANGVGCGWRCKINKTKNKCFKRPKKDDDNGGVLNKDSERSVVNCQECQDYLVKVCPGDPNWWNKPWNMTPCSECNNTSSSGNSEILEIKCKSNKNAQLKGKYNIKTPLSTINQITESSCSCIGNVNYDKCVLDNLFMECYSPGTPTPSNTVLYDKMQQLFADNPCLYGKAKCGDAADLALLKSIAQSNLNLSADLNCDLFDYLKAFPGAEIDDAVNAVKIQTWKTKYPTISSQIDAMLAAGKSVEEIEKEIELAVQMVIESPKKPINDIIDYLKCFKPNPNCTYSVTLAIDQPINGSGSSFNPVNPADVGHTFLIIKQECSDGSSVTRSLGFYPNASVVTPFNPTKPGILGNDENHNYNAQVTIQTNGTALMDLLAIIISSMANNPPHSPIYDLNTHNCTNWAVNVLSAWGVPVPTTGSEWPFSKGKGLNPGKIGEDIKQWNAQPNKSNSTEDSKTPPNGGSC